MNGNRSFSNNNLRNLEFGKKANNTILFRIHTTVKQVDCRSNFGVNKIQVHVIDGYRWRAYDLLQNNFIIARQRNQPAKCRWARNLHIHSQKQWIDLYDGNPMSWPSSSFAVVTQIGMESYFVTEQYFRTCTDYRLVTLNRFQMPLPTTFTINESGQTCVNVNGTIYAVLHPSEVLR